MLKIYDPIYSVSIDGGPWERLEDLFDTNWFVSDKDLPETELLLDAASFQEAYDYLRDNYISGARICRTFLETDLNFRYYISTLSTENISRSAKDFGFARRTDFARM